MPLDYNGKELRIKDRVRRTLISQKDGWWKFGDKVLEITSLNSYSNSSQIGINGSLWDGCKFEKVEEMTLPCVKIIPAQAEKVEVVSGRLCMGINVEPRFKAVRLVSNSTGAFIELYSSGDLREAAKAFNELADVLDKINS